MALLFLPRRTGRARYCQQMYHQNRRNHRGPVFRRQNYRLVPRQNRRCGNRQMSRNVHRRSPRCAGNLPAVRWTDWRAVLYRWQRRPYLDLCGSCQQNRQELGHSLEPAAYRRVLSFFCCARFRYFVD